MPRPSRPPVRASAIAFILLATLALGAQAGASAAPQPSAWLDAANAIVAHVQRDIVSWIEAGLRRRPVLMAGLAGALLLPLLVVAGIILRRLAPAGRARNPARRADEAVPQSAWLEIEGNADQIAARKTVAVAGEIVQIGREDDNDICIEHDTVHRYHAVIERSRDTGFIITDVSGPDGNGVLVNGERLIKSSLSDGDVVELGKARLRFATAA